MIIRLATDNDTSFLVNGLKRMVEHLRSRTKDPYCINLTSNYDQKFPEQITMFLKDETARIYIAEDLGLPLGYIIGKIACPFLPFSQIKQVGDIWICWVEPEVRGQGIAKQLTQSIEAWFSEQDIYYVELHYVVGNIEAEATWERLGYYPFRIAARKEL